MKYYLEVDSGSIFTSFKRLLYRVGVSGTHPYVKYDHSSDRIWTRSHVSSTAIKREMRQVPNTYLALTEQVL